MHGPGNMAALGAMECRRSQGCTPRCSLPLASTATISSNTPTLPKLSHTALMIDARAEVE
jgi:hypothetical protein